MDYLREGIHLRALGQKDPLSEYRLEGHQMFDETMDLVKSEFVRYMFHLELEQAAEPEAQQPAEVGYSYAADRHPGRSTATPRATTCEAGPRRPRTRSSSAERRRGRGRAARGGRGGPGRAQRPLPVRLGQEVQEVSRGVGVSTERALSLDDLVQRAARLRERAGVLGDYL